MREQQLDLFSATGVPPERRPRLDSRPQELVVADLDDGALVAAIPRAGLAEAPALAAEAGRRGLVAAVPALEQLCLRFAGFGLERAVPEQVAALDALALIGGSKAADTVARLIARNVVQGPTRKVAVEVAAQIRSALPRPDRLRPPPRRRSQGARRRLSLRRTMVSRPPGAPRSG
jgi:hypothetical protein